MAMGRHIGFHECDLNMETVTQCDKILSLLLVMHVFLASLIYKNRKQNRFYRLICPFSSSCSH